MKILTKLKRLLQTHQPIGSSTLTPTGKRIEPVYKCYNCTNIITTRQLVKNKETCPYCGEKVDTD